MPDNDGDSKMAVPPSPAKLPPLQQRKAACTHVNVTRLYGYFTCSHCGKFSDFGWVYRCTQDYHGQLPPWEGGSLPNIMEPSPESTGVDGAMSSMEFDSSDHIENAKEVVTGNPRTALKPWVEKAIAEGHYTSEQIELIKNQRQQVEDKIKEAETSFQHHQMANKKRLSSGAARRFSHRNTSITGAGITFPTLEVAAGDPVPPSVTLKVFPDCAYRSCQSCRPMLRDRSWQCFEHAWDALDSPVPNFDLDNRPICNAAVIRDISIWEVASDGASEGGSYESMCLDRAEAGELVDTDHPPQTLRRLSTSIQRKLKKGFRRLSISSEKRSQSAGAKLSSPSTKGTERAIERRRGMQTSTESDISHLAPLERQTPRLEDPTELNMIHPDANEVHTPDGVAVTEEAVDLGTADIITQV